MRDSSRSKNYSALEVAGLVCFVMGFAMYIAVDTGVVKIGAWSKSRGVSDLASIDDSDRPMARIARIKALHDQIDNVETKMKEKVEVLGKMNDEIQSLAKRVTDEKKGLNSLSTMVFEIEKNREDLKRESGMLSSEGKISLSGALEKIASEAQKNGIEKTRIGAIKWQKRDYLRLVNAFDFQSEGFYLLGVGIDRADSVATALEDSGVHEVKVVYRELANDSQKLTKERAFVLRNHFRDLLGEEFNVKVSRINSELVSPGAVELWVGRE